MGPGTPHWLVALGLDLDADERSIRRAYAQRLKRIDPAEDPQAFQALRSAYETAMQWATRRVPPQEPDPIPTTAPPPLPPSTDPEVSEEKPCDSLAFDPHAPALQVYAEFATACAHSLADEASAKHALEAALADPRLLNFEARVLFEWRVAALLLDGWRPGHEFLFGPACDCFDWERDRRRLEMFGPAGAALDAAINEKLIFFRQPPAHFEVQRKLIRGLRDERMPGRRSLIEEMPHLQLLVQRYPHWLRIVTSRENYAQRLQAFEAIPVEERQQPVPAFVSPVPNPPLKLPSYSNLHVRWFAIAAFIVFMGIVGGSRREPTYHRAPPATLNAPVFPATGATRPPTSVRLPGQPADPPLFDFAGPVQAPEVVAQQDRVPQTKPVQRRSQGDRQRTPQRYTPEQAVTSQPPTDEAPGQATGIRSAPGLYDLLPPSGSAAPAPRLGQ